MSKLSPLLQWFSIALTMAGNSLPPIPAAFNSLFMNIYELRKTFYRLVNDYQGQNGGVVKRDIEKHSKTQSVDDKEGKEYRNDTSESSNGNAPPPEATQKRRLYARDMNISEAPHAGIEPRMAERVRKKGSILAFLLIVSCIPTAGANAEIRSNFIAEVDQPVTMTRDLSGAVIQHSEISFTSTNGRHTFETVCSFDLMKASSNSRGSGLFEFITCLPNGLNISHAQFNYTGTFKMIISIKDSDVGIQHTFNLTVVVPDESRGTVTTVFENCTSTEEDDKTNGAPSNYWNNILIGFTVAALAVIILCVLLGCFHNEIREKFRSQTKKGTETKVDDVSVRMIKDDEIRETPVPSYDQC